MVLSEDRVQWFHPRPSVLKWDNITHQKLIFVLVWFHVDWKLEHWKPCRKNPGWVVTYRRFDRRAFNEGSRRPRSWSVGSHVPVPVLESLRHVHEVVMEVSCLSLLPGRVGGKGTWTLVHSGDVFLVPLGCGRRRSQDTTKCVCPWILRDVSRFEQTTFPLRYRTFPS